MKKRETESWLNGFVDDLSVGGERVPLERVIALRLDGFITLRDQGLTWRAIAALIARAGGRRKDGTYISGDQLRAVVSRLLVRQSAEQKREPSPIKKEMGQPLPTDTLARPLVGRKQGRSPSPEQSVFTGSDIQPKLATSSVVEYSKDLTSGEIAAALARIHKSNML